MTRTSPSTTSSGAAAPAERQSVDASVLGEILSELRTLSARVDALTPEPVPAAPAPPVHESLPAPHIGPELRAAIDNALNAVPLDFGGGSGRAKAYVFASLILQHDVRRVVEIGVYRGRSLLPLATVLRAVGGGVAMGIDPWAADDAMQYDDHAGGTDAARQWTRDTDWEGIYQSVVDNAQRLGVADIIELVRMPSLAAADLIDPGVADLVHVDGNHDADAVAQDVEKYLPKIRPGGFLALDDASWSSIRPTARMLEDNFERVFELCDNQLHVYDKGGHDFAVYRVSAH